MEINDLNYEQYALDYAEGNLEAESLKAMEQFLSEHQGLKEEILLACSIRLTGNDSVVFEDNASLLKPSSAIRFWPFAFAISTAASIVLAIGCIALLSQQNRFGELADESIHVIFQKNIVIINESDNYKIKANLNPEFSDENWQSKEVNYASNKSIEPNLYEFDVFPKKTAISDTKIDPLQKETPIFVIKEDQNSNTSKVPEFIHEQVMNSREFDLVIETSEPEMKPNNVDKEPVEVVDLVADISLNDAAVTQNKNLSQEKIARRKVIKEGAWSIFQQAFIPEGVVNLVSN